MAPRQKRNPVESAILSWYKTQSESLTSVCEVHDLVAQAPKRWMAYGPMVLLPAGSFTSSAWREALQLSADPPRYEATRNQGGESHDGAGDPKLLWKTMLDEIRKSSGPCTHLAVNEVIPLHVNSSQDSTENILRSPSGLRMLYGDFGPSELSRSRLVTSLSMLDDENEKPEAQYASESEDGSVRATDKPTEEDFLRAFWVSTKQNGITQTWAPRWTMFSRGNIKEKARILNFHNPQDSLPLRHHEDRLVPDRTPLFPHRAIPASERRGAIAVDLYAGIGYFALCYASLGFRVLCWELNPWSVEGLRRGALANGWGVRAVIPPDEVGYDPIHDEDDAVMRGVLQGRERIVVFLENNLRAADRIRKLHGLASRHGLEETQTVSAGLTTVGSRGREKLDASTRHHMRNVLHVNCGFLPSSEGSWSTAWDIASQSEQAWIHIHENVGAADINERKDEIERWFAEHRRRMGSEADSETDICVEHVELVKTFAPGVWHCVFDLYIRRHIREGPMIP